MKTKAYQPVDSVERLEEKLESVRAAQRQFATYTQEQVDKIFLAAATAANKQRIPLAKLAVEETGMGIVEDKVIKNHYASEYIYNAYKDVKTCGVLEEDKAYGVKKIAEPIGVIAAVIPTTNPTSTAIFKCLLALKTRNGIIISPHPRAKGATVAAAKIVLEAAVAAGAPEGIIGWIDVPSLDMTNTLMKDADIILATGGPGMVKAAYSSGTPALGVGAGNTPAIIDDSADILLAVNSIIHSKTFDNGMICASEQSVIVLDKVYDAVKTEFAVFDKFAVGYRNLLACFDFAVTTNCNRKNIGTRSLGNNRNACLSLLRNAVFVLNSLTLGANSHYVTFIEDFFAVFDSGIIALSSMHGE